MDAVTAQAAVAEAVKRLAAEFSPVAIYHFGSSVPGASAEPNDIDLLVVVERSGEGLLDRSARALSLMFGLGVPVDVQVYTRAEFEEWAQRPHSLERLVSERGRVVYAA